MSSQELIKLQLAAERRVNSVLETRDCSGPQDCAVWEETVKLAFYPVGQLGHKT